MATTGGTSILFNAHTVDPASQVLGGSLYSNDASEGNYILIHFRRLLTGAEEQELHELHALFCQSIPENTYLCKYEPADLEAIRQKPFVVYANVLHKDLKVNYYLRLRLLPPASNGDTAASPIQSIHCLVVLHSRSERDHEHLKDQMVNEFQISRDRMFLEGDNMIRGYLYPNEILSLVNIDDVKAIEEFKEMAEFNNLARGIVSLTRDVPQGQTFNPPSAARGLDGTGQIVVVADSGFDQGFRSDGTTIDDDHPFFKGKVALIESQTKTGITADRASHGTHVAGTVLGNDYQAVFANPREWIDYDELSPPLSGAAPGAQLILQAIWSDPVNPKTDLWGTVKDKNGKDVISGGNPKLRDKDAAVKSLYLDVYEMSKPQYEALKNLKPRIHSNSWGLPTYGPQEPYDALATIIDQIIRTNDDYLIVRAAGNEGDLPKAESADGVAILTDKGVPVQFGDDNAQIQSYGASKNGLTVGACHSTRKLNVDENPPIEMKYDPTRGRARDGTFVARFSNRGPCKTADANANGNGIIKPDLVAPGVAIFSANSRARKTIPEGGPSPDNYCTMKTGTSMACPLVAGAAAIIRQALQYRLRPSSQPFPAPSSLSTQPSAAAIKAVLINGALDLSTKDGHLAGGKPEIKDKLRNGTPNPDAANGGKRNGGKGLPAQRLQPAPNFVQGFGRLNVKASLENVMQTDLSGIYEARLIKRPTPLVDLEQRLTMDGDFKTKTTFIPQKVSQRANFKVTMAYTDWPGDGLQNILSLRLSFPNSPAIPDVIIRDATTGVPDPANLIQAGNNVQKLIQTGIDASAGDVQVDMIVRAHKLKDPSGAGGVPPPQAFALAWLTWYG